MAGTTRRGPCSRSPAPPVTGTYYLEQEWDYEVWPGRDGGALGRATVRLTNTAPTAGRDRTVLGPNVDFLRAGENLLYVSTYCAPACALSSFSVDGEPSTVAAEREFDVAGDGATRERRGVGAHLRVAPGAGPGRSHLPSRRARPAGDASGPAAGHGASSSRSNLRQPHQLGSGWGCGVEDPGTSAGSSYWRAPVPARRIELARFGRERHLAILERRVSASRRAARSRRR
jgi:hypothetical protein